MRILVRGGGDLASGVVLRLWRAGWDVLITEISQPLAVRRLVSFANAVYLGEMDIEGIHSVLVSTPGDAQAALTRRVVPVIVDEGAESREWFKPQVLVDARMLKKTAGISHPAAPLSIGLGPGFMAGKDCHAVVETKRGPFLGRVYWQGEAEPDSGIPESIANFSSERVLRTPVDGVFKETIPIGSFVEKGDLIACVGQWQLLAPFNGVVRGLVWDGLVVQRNMKIGDVDPRGDARLCRLISEKSLAIGGAVLEAILIWQADEISR
ncbi:MAG TPA: selenium-dependent molybdenum cofactor biosynthesis protein YqeB [Longilinea sp.]|nr:selenium-dependent molybdenum cofactor biosynthesis protein YqeB [Longilinea sp.]